MDATDAETIYSSITHLFEELNISIHKLFGFAISNSDYYLLANNFFCGGDVETYIRQNNLDDRELHQFRLIVSCISFYGVLCKPIRSRIDFTDYFLNNVQLLDRVVSKHFPHILLNNNALPLELMRYSEYLRSVISNHGDRKCHTLSGKQSYCYLYSAKKTNSRNFIDVSTVEALILAKELLTKDSCGTFLPSAELLIFVKQK